MHGLQSMFILNTLVFASFHIYALCGEDTLKGEVGGCTLNVIEITLLIMEVIEKSWNCVFKFLWEPC